MKKIMLILSCFILVAAMRCNGQGAAKNCVSFSFFSPFSQEQNENVNENGSVISLIFILLLILILSGRSRIRMGAGFKLIKSRPLQIKASKIR
jgi:hypothetical protein